MLLIERIGLLKTPKVNSKFAAFYNDITMIDINSKIELGKFLKLPVLLQIDIFRVFFLYEGLELNIHAEGFLLTVADNNKYKETIQTYIALDILMLIDENHKIYGYPYNVDNYNPPKNNYLAQIEYWAIEGIVFAMDVLNNLINASTK